MKREERRWMARPIEDIRRQRRETFEVLLFPILMLVVLFALAFTTPTPPAAGADASPIAPAAQEVAR